jgi:hypothetical protein
VDISDDVFGDSEWENNDGFAFERMIDRPVKNINGAYMISFDGSILYHLYSGVFGPGVVINMNRFLKVVDNIELGHMVLLTDLGNEFSLLFSSGVFIVSNSNNWKGTTVDISRGNFNKKVIVVTSMIKHKVIDVVGEMVLTKDGMLYSCEKKVILRHIKKIRGSSGIWAALDSAGTIHYNTGRRTESLKGKYSDVSDFRVSKNLLVLLKHNGTVEVKELVEHDLGISFPQDTVGIVRSICCCSRAVAVVNTMGQVFISGATQSDTLPTRKVVERHIILHGNNNQTNISDKHPAVFISSISMDRCSNIYVIAAHPNMKVNTTDQDTLQKCQDCGIIYCADRNTIECIKTPHSRGIVHHMTSYYPCCKRNSDALGCVVNIHEPKLNYLNTTIV